MSDERLDIEKNNADAETALVRRYQPGAYPEPYIDEYQLDYNEGGSQEGQTHKFREILMAVRSRMWWVLGFAAAVTTITAIEMLSVRPTYSASAIVEVRKENAPLIIANNGESDADGQLNLNTKLLLFKGRPLLEDVVNRLKLDQNA